MVDIGVAGDEENIEFVPAPGRHFGPGHGNEGGGVQGLAALVPDEVLDGAVIAALALGGEETSGNLALLPVMHDAFAAVAALVAGGIGAGAMLERCLGNAFH